MNAKPVDPSLEPERYELAEGPRHLFEIERRGFLRMFGGGLVVLAVAGRASAQESGRGRRGEATPGDVAAWLHIAEDGAVTIYTGKAEVGQNIRTSLTQAVAEELRVPAASIALVMGDTRLTPYDQGTFGSRTTPYMAPQLRRAAAAARERLVDLASQRWQCDRAQLAVDGGRVTDPATGRSVSFGELTKGQRLATAIAAEASLTPADRWRVAGTSMKKVTGRAIVTGAHQYTPDLKRPGMVVGRVVRPSAFGATLASLDATAAERMPGVTVVRDADFVGVVVPDERTAARAAAEVKTEWKVSPQPSASALVEILRTRTEGRPQVVVNAGAVDAALMTADHTLERRYTVAYIAHVPLEPRAAVAEWTGEGLTVWTGTQRPFGVQEELAEAFHLPPERVRVIVPDTGSGYGGKHTGDAAVEAARLAKAAGRPVKVVWTREEEFTWAYFRPAGVIDVQSGVRRDGTLVAWAFDNYNSGTAAIRTPYDVANQRVVFHPAQSPLRQGSYRGLAATANHFARETHMDELAGLVALDPLDFRLRNLKDARLRAVLEAAARKFGWPGARGSDRQAGGGVGIAGGVEKGGYVATAAAVRVDPQGGGVRVERLVVAFECGAIVNPNGLENQVVGAVIQGLGGALFEAVRFENGRILNASFGEYRMPRFSDVPPIEAVLLDRRDLPSAGAGETPIVGVAPAIGNAIFDATGVRLRGLPLVPQGLPKTTQQAPEGLAFT